MSSREVPAEHRPGLDEYLQPYRDAISQFWVAENWEMALRNLNIVLDLLVPNTERVYCRTGFWSPPDVIDEMIQQELPTRCYWCLWSAFQLHWDKAKVLFYMDRYEEAAEWFWQYGKLRAFFESTGETQLGAGAATLGHHPEHEQHIEQVKVVSSESLREGNVDKAIQDVKSLYVGPVARNPGCLWCKLRALPVYMRVVEKAEGSTNGKSFRMIHDRYNSFMQVLKSAGAAEL